MSCNEIENPNSVVVEANLAYDFVPSVNGDATADPLTPRQQTDNTSITNRASDVLPTGASSFIDSDDENTAPLSIDNSDKTSTMGFSNSVIDDITETLNQCSEIEQVCIYTSIFKSQHQTT